ncbi:uncharacterized protein BX664DRAFT_89561 [Halteromyces radiatus]|uniref:uncharacterized protein n=1 Tax=Halteromyces radiatus TaxID=101107 RepID=UPI00221E430B|nr:uncharacterized protein BX664DRAFT_89561 [Halteromyces radiatus]KAI8092539.1 hypothetical protein BX664DRAFT_89561 [Halteromyces radiatus]
MFWAKDIVQDEKTGEHKWTLNQLYQLTHANRIDSTFDSSDIVSLSFSQKRTLLTGNRNGQVYAFVLPDTSDTLHYLKEDRCKECAQCGKSFSVLERKSFCRSCGGLFCLPCISNIPTTVPDKSARFCKYCQSRLLE